MIILVICLFILKFVIGLLLLDLFWKTENWALFFLKSGLSIGVGLGISSLTYFFHLLLFSGKPYFIYFEVAILIILICIRHKKGWSFQKPKLEALTPVQIAIAIVAAVVVSISLLGLANYVFHRQEGDWDAWMIFNRAARSIYRDPELWREAFSKDLDTIFHADYPPMLAMNIAANWEVLGADSVYVPIIESVLFTIACGMALTFALAYQKSVAQAGLGMILIMGAKSFISEGGRQTADIPLAFFMLASVIFFFLYYHERQPFSIILAGFCAGLAAWTKNEGTLFLLAVGLAAATISIREKSAKALFFLAAGTILPLVAVLYFKFQVAPPSEFSQGNIQTQVLDISRHGFILTSFKNTFLRFGAHNIKGLLPLLVAYGILASSKNKLTSNEFLFTSCILVIQISGYYFIYLISPYDLEWHINYSISRLTAQVYPIFVYLVLYLSKTPEALFASNAE
jgi:hypothetical protein